MRRQAKRDTLQDTNPSCFRAAASRTTRAARPLRHKRTGGGRSSHPRHALGAKRAPRRGAGSAAGITLAFPARLGFGGRGFACATHAPRASFSRDRTSLRRPIQRPPRPPPLPATVARPARSTPRGQGVQVQPGVPALYAPPPPSPHAAHMRSSPIPPTRAAASLARTT